MEFKQCQPLQHIIKNFRMERQWSNLFKLGQPINTLEQLHTNRIDEENSHHYYEEYKKIYLSSYKLKMQLERLGKVTNTIKLQLERIQRKKLEFQENAQENNRERRKRCRRTNDQIQRRYTCQVQYCGKCYGSEGSLQQHIKLKHPQLYQSNKTD